jgi:hypothetical protein
VLDCACSVKQGIRDAKAGYLFSQRLLPNLSRWCSSAAVAASRRAAPAPRPRSSFLARRSLRDGVPGHVATRCNTLFIDFGQTRDAGAIEWRVNKSDLGLALLREGREGWPWPCPLQAFADQHGRLSQQPLSCSACLVPQLGHPVGKSREICVHTTSLASMPLPRTSNTSLNTLPLTATAARQQQQHWLLP